MFSFDHSKLILRIQFDVFRSEHKAFCVRDEEFNVIYSMRSYHQQAQPKMIVEYFPRMRTK